MPSTVKPIPEERNIKSEVSLTSQIFVLDRKEITLTLNDALSLSLLCLTLVS